MKAAIITTYRCVNRCATSGNASDISQNREISLPDFKYFPAGDVES